jgi:hypothetical protein
VDEKSQIQALERTQPILLIADNYATHKTKEEKKQRNLSIPSLFRLPRLRGYKYASADFHSTTRGLNGVETPAERRLARFPGVGYTFPRAGKAPSYL